MTAPPALVNHLPTFTSLTKGGRRNRHVWAGDPPQLPLVDAFAACRPNRTGLTSSGGEGFAERIWVWASRHDQGFVRVTGTGNFVTVADVPPDGLAVLKTGNDPAEPRAFLGAELRRRSQSRRGQHHVPRECQLGIQAVELVPEPHGATQRDDGEFVAGGALFAGHPGRLATQ